MPRTERRWFSLLVVLLSLPVLPYARAIDPNQRVDVAAAETAWRPLVEGFYAAYPKEDVDGFMALWSPAAPERTQRHAQMQQLFANHDRIEVHRVTVRQITVDGDRASLRVDVEMSAVDAKTGQAAAGFGKMMRAFNWVKENGSWKVWQEVDATERLAVQLVAARTEDERSGLLTTQTELVTNELLRAISRLGIRALLQWDYPQALACFHLAHAVAERLGNKPGMAVALNDVGVAHKHMAHYDLAADFFLKSLTLNNALGIRREIARTMNNLGDVNFHRGNYGAALGYHDKALAVLGDAPETAQERQIAAETLFGIGIVYHAQRNYEMALTYHQRALSAFSKLDNKAFIAMTRERIARIYSEQGRFGLALEQYEESLRLASGTHQTSGIEGGVGALLGVMSDVYAMQERYDLALEYKQRALARQEAWGRAGNQRAIASTLSDIAALHLRDGRPAEALVLTQRAAMMARQVGSLDILWQVRNTAGKAHWAKGEARQAQEAFEEAIATIESLRTDVAGGEVEQQRFFEDKLSPYHGMVEVLLAQNQMREAVIVAERAKARVLLDVLHSGLVNITKAMSTREREQEGQFVDDLRLVNTQIVRERIRALPDPARLAELQEQLQGKRQALEAFRTSLYAAHPGLRVHRGEAPPAGLDDVADVLPDSKTALLKFVVMDQTTYLFAVTKNGDADRSPLELKVYPVAIERGELVKFAARLREQIGRRDLGFRTLAKELYRLLLSPAQVQLRGKTALIVVPDGPLWELPFQALLNDDRYLIEDYVVAYAPSLSVLKEMIRLRQQRTERPISSQELLALGNPALPGDKVDGLQLIYRDRQLPPLPDAEKEVTRLGQLYGAKQSKVYVGAEAREDRLKMEAGSYRVVHVAAHGILNHASPMYSHVMLSQTEGTGTDDGLLEAWELMRMDLNAELMVLSACDTALGHVGAGEGIIGLTWALFVAGVPTAVVSQWKVESASTTALMIDFHRRLRATRSGPPALTKARALQQAALTLLRSSQYRHPFYWAAFVLMGDGR